MKLKVGKQSLIPRMCSKEKYVVFGDACIGVVESEGKNFLIIATYNYRGKWKIVTLEEVTQELIYKIGRIGRFVTEVGD